MQKPKRKSGAASLTTTTNARETATVIAVSIFLVAAVFAVFGSTLNHQFLNYDDDNYVYSNPRITGGLTFSGIAWAFTHFHADNWHPLTTISHMLDCQLYGLQPWGHHLTNVLLHAAATVLLFLALRELTSGVAVAAHYERRDQTRPAVIDRRYNVWACAFVATLFAIHPLRVESVAWISERKDVLSGVFFMLTLLAYARYARRCSHGPAVAGSPCFEKMPVRLGPPRPAFAWLRRGKQSGTAATRWPLGSYLAVIIFFTLGLMSKPTLVTLPFVLLLLDYWPLGRWPGAGSSGSQGANFTAGGREHFANRPREGGDSVLVKTKEHGDKREARSGTSQEQIPRVVSTSQRLNASTSATWSLVSALVIEKIPLLILSAASCVITILAQKEAFTAMQQLPFQQRFANAVVAYVIYVGQTIWPRNLAVLYPYPVAGISAGTVILALVLLWSVSIACFLCRQRNPYLIVGWLWFLGMLVPMIGIVQVGSQPRADRYTYLPQIGLYLLIIWGAMDLVREYRPWRAATAAAGLMVLAAMMVQARNQTSVWKDSETLWRNAVKLTSHNHIAHNSLGNALLEKGRLDEAIVQYTEALAIRPDVAPVESNLGNALLREKRADEAIVHFQKAIQIDPKYAEAYNDMGSGLIEKGQFSEAISYYQKAIHLNPDYADAHNNLGAALLETGQLDQAIEHYKKAVVIRPASAEMQCNLANAYAKSGNWAEAIASYHAALKARPDYAKAHNNLGVCLETVGRVNEAFEEFRHALQFASDYAEAHCNLGRLLAQRGQRDEAVAHLTEALRLKPDYEDAKKQLRRLGVEN